MFRTRSLARGFTLVELVLALALGSLLMAAIVGVLKGTTQQLNVAREQTNQSWQPSTLEQLHSDMQLASRIRSSDGWIWFEGEFNEFSNDSTKADQVGYQCVPWVDGRTALIRTSDHATELIAVGPRRIVIERLDMTNTPQPLSPTYTSMPERVRLWIWTEDPVNAELQRDLALR